MTIHFTLEAVAELQAIPTRDAGRLFKAIERLQGVRTGRVAEEGLAAGVNITAIVGQPGVFRVRQGDWRALIVVTGVDAKVVKVGNRKDVYS